MIHTNWQFVYVQYTKKKNIESDNETHDNNSGMMIDTNKEHTWIDEDESQIDEDQTCIEEDERIWEEKTNKRE